MHLRVQLQLAVFHWYVNGHPAVDSTIALLEIPSLSASCIYLAVASAELRPSGPTAAFSHNTLGARSLAMTRLEELSARLPSKPVFMIIKLVKEVWRRFDIGDGSVFWLDVMHENGWQTVIG